MKPERKEIIGGHVVEEYYWAGEFVVYLDNKKTEESFEKTLKRLRKNEKSRIYNRAKTEALKSIGLRRVRGALGGIYWE